MKSHAHHLLRVLGLAFALAAVVGAVVGQGILRSPGIVAQASGSEAVLLGLWVLGAGLAMLAALPFAELSAAIPRAGGPIAFASRAFGRRMRVVTAYTLVIMNLSSTAMLAFVTGEFLVRLGVGGGWGPGAIASVLLVLFFFLNGSARAPAARFRSGCRVSRAWCSSRWSWCCSRNRARRPPARRPRPSRMAG